MPELNNIEAVLFDVDGTLLNTFEFIYQSFEHALAAHNLPALTRDTISHLMGGPLEECYSIMAPGCDAAALAEAHRVFQFEHIDLAQPFEATIDVLEYLTMKQFKLGAITTRSLRTSIRSMEATGIAGYFAVILSAEDVTNHKPHPEPLLKALNILNSTPERAVMIGDTYADILAGKNAGTRTVLSLYGFGSTRALEAGPDFTIGDIAEIKQLI